ncbi:unnamed protein product [Rhizophagus irregularis]|uniref:Uncharacterized protein n=1 Tax=Rhizophagus irregularis TaxID=588596 RepID=A0A915ZL91_9GLOM|nr:unnamed protein product [Rhizophagus irregularis]
MPEANLPTRSKCWHPTLVSVHENIKQSCVEHGHGGHWNAPNYQVEDVIYIDMKECYPASIRGQGECSPWFKQFGHLTYHFVQVAVEGELPSNDITGFVQTKGWTPIILLRYLLEAGILKSVTIGEAIISFTKQTKGWLPKNWDISCAIIEKFTQGNKVKEKRLIHQVVIDEVVRIAIDSIYIRRDVLYKIENVSAFFKQAKRPFNHKGGADTSKFQCSHKIPSCAMCEAGVFYSKEAVKEFAKEVKVHYVNRITGYLSYNEYKPFVCAICFGEWYFHQGPWKNTQPSKVVTKEYWKSIKNITKSIAPSIHDPITRSRVSYLNGGGGSEKTTRAIQIFKDINMVVFTHTNALAKDFQNNRKVKAQTWHSFFRWN